MAALLFARNHRRMPAGSIEVSAPLGFCETRFFRPHLEALTETFTRAPQAEALHAGIGGCRFIPRVRHDPRRSRAVFPTR